MKKKYDEIDFIIADIDDNSYSQFQDDDRLEGHREIDTSYIEEEYSEGEYLEEEYFEDEYIEDEYIEDDYIEDEYLEDEYSEDEYLESEYLEEDDLEDDYLENDYLEDEDLDYEESEYQSNTVGNKILQFVKNGHAIDAIVAATGILVIAVGLTLASFWLSAGKTDDQVTAMASVGQQLSGIVSVGESGLLAITNAYFTEINSAPDITNEDQVVVTASFTSMSRDLKINFLNKETEELITGVTFEAILTDSKGDETTLKDSNKDGVIHEENMEPGEYQVLLKSVSGFNFPSKPQTVKVKDKLEYSQVDIMQEVKDESEINAAIEDLKPEVIIPETTLKDTVEYVPSTKTPVGNKEGYVSIDKSKIPNPTSLTSRFGGFQLMTTTKNNASVSISGPETLKAGTTTGKATVSIKQVDAGAKRTGEEYTWTITDPSTISSGSSEATITASNAGKENVNATISVSVSWTETSGVSENKVSADYTKTATKTIVITPADVAADKVTGIAISGATEIVEGGTSQLTTIVTMDPEDATPDSYAWKSDDNDIATVSTEGLVTGKKAGTVNISVTATAGSSSARDSHPITVTAKTATVESIEINQGSTTMKIDGTLDLSATANMSDNTRQTDYGCEWGVTGDNGIVTVNGSTGLVTAKKEGTATITATANEKSDTIEIKVEKADPTTYVTEVKASSTSISLEETKQLTAEVKGKGDYNKTVKWEVKSGGDYISITSDGKVTGKKVTGTSLPVVRVTTDGTNLTGEKEFVDFNVTVTKKTITLAIAPTTLSLKKGNTHKVVGTLGNTIGSTDKTLTYSSNKPEIAKVDSKTGLITAVKEGVANISVTSKANDLDATCVVTVIKNAEADTTSKLKDSAGNQVYVKKTDGSYREAKYADYFEDGAKYFLKGSVEYTYTGWQTLNNKTYYFDKHGKKVTGEQVIQGVKYNFAGDGSLSMGNGTLMIDVSKWQGNINWTAVKNSGVSSVIIRCGYRGTATGVLVEDQKFKANIQGATAAGLKVGVYIFSQAINEVEAVQEASMALSLVKGYNLTYPIFIDVESGSRANSISVAERTAVIKAFAQTVTNSGYKAGVYANKNWFETKINASELTQYTIWLAHYTTQTNYTKTKHDIWQYSETGRIGGISGGVDMNKNYLSY